MSARSRQSKLSYDRSTAQVQSSQQQAEAEEKLREREEKHKSEMERVTAENVSLQAESEGAKRREKEAVEALERMKSKVKEMGTISFSLSRTHMHSHTIHIRTLHPFALLPCTVPIAPTLSHTHTLFDSYASFRARESEGGGEKQEGYQRRCQSIQGRVGKKGEGGEGE